MCEDLLQANNAAMAVFSPLDTNVIPGFQYNSSATPLSSFPQGGARAALASWAKKPAEQTASTPPPTLAGTYGLHPCMLDIAILKRPPNLGRLLSLSGSEVATTP